MSGQQVVELLNEAADGWYELNETLRHDNRTKVLTLRSTVGNGLAELVDNLIECHVFLLYFLRD